MSATLRATERRQTPAEIEAGARARMTSGMEATIQEIVRYVGTHAQGKIILAWRPDGQVTMERHETWYPPRTRD